MPAGQVYIGSKQVAEPTVFTGLATFSQTIKAGGTVPAATAVAAGAGTGSSAGAVTGYDMGGSFTLTTAGTPAAGEVAAVTFGTALQAPPSAVIVSAADTTAANHTAVAVAAGVVTSSGFQVYAPALTTAHTYLINWVVIQ